MPSWTSEQVASLAPDAASATAARSVATLRLWSALGHDGRAVWGTCRSYPVSIDLAGPAFVCGCPSRKVPCKHALGLLLLWASDPDAVPEGPAPAQVQQWLAQRDARAARPAPAEKKPVDPEARAKRMADRAARIGAGLEELDRWLRDLVRQGLAPAQSRPFSYWDDMAARMVDAQAPGAGSQVRRMAGIVRSGNGWPGRLLAAAGRLHLVCEAWGRLDTLPAGTQADVRTALGWSWTAEEVLALGPPVRDRWQVVARAVVEEEYYRTQRTWLVGGGRTAVVIDSAAAGAPLPSELVVGTEIDAGLAFFPGSWPQRAIVAGLHGPPDPMETWPGAATVDEALAGHATALAANPWLDRLPMVLAGMTPAGDLRVRDAAGASVRLRIDEPAWWLVAAVSGGRPMGLAGEWQDGRLRPLSVWADGRLTVLP